MSILTEEQVTQFDHELNHLRASQRSSSNWILLPQRVRKLEYEAWVSGKSAGEAAT